MPSSVTLPHAKEATAVSMAQEGRQKQVESQQRYDNSPKGKARYQRYSQSEKGKARHKSYDHSEKGKQAQNESSKRWNRKHRQPRTAQ